MPWSVAEVEDFIKILGGFTSGNSSQGYRNWVTARVRQDIELNRAIHLWGERNARLGNLQSRLDIRPEGRPHPLARLTRFISFGTADEYLTKLDGLWVDKITNKRSWRPFAQETRAKMTEIMLQAIAISLVSLVLFGISLPHERGASPFVNLILATTLTAFITSIASAATAFGLYCTFSGLSNVSAPVAGDYLEREHHEMYGFYHLAVRLSIPRSLLIYTLGISFLTVIFAILNALQVSWDKLPSPYFFAIPSFVAFVPIAYLAARILRQAIRALKRRFRSIELPLHHCANTGRRLSIRPFACLGFLILFTFLLIAFFLVLKPENSSSLFRILTTQRFS